MSISRDHLFAREQIDEVLANRRRSERIVIKVPVSLLLKGNVPASSGMKEGDCIPGITINISAGGLLRLEGEEGYGSGGLLVETQSPMPVDALVETELSLPMPGFVGNFLVEGRILRCVSLPGSTGKYQVGLCFTKILSHHFNNVKLDIVKKMLGL